MKDERQKYVAFGDESVKNAFNKLTTGKFEDKKNARHDKPSNERLKTRTFHRNSYTTPLMAYKLYIQKYNINNLWKYDLPNGWRLIYTIKGSEIEIISIILEWMNHANYDKRFNY